jgi:hypothetical protein
MVERELEFMFWNKTAEVEEYRKSSDQRTTQLLMLKGIVSVRSALGKKNFIQLNDKRTPIITALIAMTELCQEDVLKLLGIPKGTKVTEDIWQGFIDQPQNQDLKECLITSAKWKKNQGRSISIIYQLSSQRIHGDFEAGGGDVVRLKSDWLTLEQVKALECILTKFKIPYERVRKVGVWTVEHMGHFSCCTCTRAAVAIKHTHLGLSAQGATVSITDGDDGSTQDQDTSM